MLVEYEYRFTEYEYEYESSSAFEVRSVFFGGLPQFRNNNALFEPMVYATKGAAVLSTEKRGARINGDLQ